jgi:hypothetical protein
MTHIFLWIFIFNTVKHIQNNLLVFASKYLSACMLYKTAISCSIATQTEKLLQQTDAVMFNKQGNDGGRDIRPHMGGTVVCKSP